MKEKEQKGRSRRQLIEKEEVKGEEERRRKKRKGYVRKRRSMYQWKDILLAEQMVLQ